jgi:hypothetical protein
MSGKLLSLRDELCKGSASFCRACFEGGPTEKNQTPPNVFRVREGSPAKIFFIFDKPNDNDGNCAFVPIKVFDPCFSNPTQRNLLTLLDLLTSVHAGFRPARGRTDPFSLDMVHITNAVKCDKPALAGDSGGIEVGGQQAEKCVSTFLHRELAIIEPKALVFFGVLPYQYPVGPKSKAWDVTSLAIAGKSYWAMRVPHTADTPFYSHGGGGKNYLEPFRRLMTHAGLLEGQT